MFLALKVFLSIAFVVLAFSIVEGGLSDLQIQFSWQLVALSLFIHPLQAALAAMRWQTANRLIGIELSLYQAFEFTLYEKSFNSVFPSTLAGDTLRFSLLQKYSATKRSILSIVIDRGISVVSAAVACIPVAFFLLRERFSFLFHDAILVSIITLLFVSITFAVFLVYVDRLTISIFGYDLTKLMRRAIRKIRGNLRLSFQLLIVALLHNVAGYVWFIAVLPTITINVLTWSVLFVPLIFFSTLIPFFVAGWGIREIIAVYLFSLAGIASTSVFQASILFGLLTFMAAIVWMGVIYVHSYYKKSRSNPK